MKIGIVTIIGYLNYGNRLQNYAVQETLKKLNFEAETIYNELGNYNTFEKRDSLNVKIKELINNYSFKQVMMLVMNKVTKKIFRKKTMQIKNLNLEKRDNLYKFTMNNIKQSKEKIIKNNIPEGLNSKYDYFVVGSDQVWNPYHRKGYLVDFLNFASNDKKVAYSASFGIDKIPSEYQEIYKENLKSFKSISVREDVGALIVNELTNIMPEVLVDPTMMLTEQEWTKIIKEDKAKPKKDYLLTYILGDYNEDKRKQVNDIARKSGLEVVNLAQLNDKQYYTCGPEAFLDYIKSSQIFITDSFHGVVFSIIFKKPFLVYERGNMNSRINTLLDKFSFQQRKIDRVNFNEIYTIDFSHCDEILNYEREKACKYLLEALK